MIIVALLCRITDMVADSGNQIPLSLFVGVAFDCGV
jgi:hypothetical protein